MTVVTMKTPVWKSGALGPISSTAVQCANYIYLTAEILEAQRRSVSCSMSHSLYSGQWSLKSDRLLGLNDSHNNKAHQKSPNL